MDRRETSRAVPGFSTLAPRMVQSKSHLAPLAMLLLVAGCAAQPAAAPAPAPEPAGSLLQRAVAALTPLGSNVAAVTAPLPGLVVGAAAPAASAVAGSPVVGAVVGAAAPVTSAAARAPLPSAVASVVGGLTGSTPAPEPSPSSAQGKHVLLISVDGMHGSDLTMYVAERPNSTLAALAANGTVYTSAYTSMPSDSFPGVLNLVTGGSPKSTGVWYDTSYDRTLYPPGSNCTGPPGTQVVYDESIDKNTSAVINGGGLHAINPAALPLEEAYGQCTAVSPHQYLRVNTIFELIAAQGNLTAWADKQPAYDLLTGPSGDGVFDLYTPDINGIYVNGSKVWNFTTNPSETPTYDTLHCNAVLNWIQGKNSTGGNATGIPTILGVNFQSVSVAQKYAGYENTSLTFTPALLAAFDYVDAQIGSFVDALDTAGLLPNDTLIIITAKHGQSPIDPKKVIKVNDTSLEDLISAHIPGEPAQVTSDTEALIWLHDINNTEAVVELLSNPNNAVKYGVGELGGAPSLLYGAGLVEEYGDPSTDPRVPDIIIESSPGVIYTTDPAKEAEHGGFGQQDANVALLVVGPGFPANTTIDDYVSTRQVAPTILEFLGIDPQLLDAVLLEGTQALPNQTYTLSTGAPPSPLAFAMAYAAAPSASSGTATTSSTSGTAKASASAAAGDHKPAATLLLACVAATAFLSAV